MERKRFSFEGLARPAMTIFAAAVLGGFLNYLFQSYMGRTLGPDEYSQLASLLSIFYILIIPSTLIGTTVLFYVSRLKAEEKDGEIAWLMRRNLRLCLLVGVVMGLVMLLLSPFLLEFLDIDQPMMPTTNKPKASLSKGWRTSYTARRLKRCNAWVVL